MFAGTIAGIVGRTQPPESRVPILMAGLTMQGFGFIVSLLMYALWIGRMMQYGLPAPNLRPGMMIAVGPPSFTAVGLITISNDLPADYGYFAAHPGSIEILQVVALFSAIFIWSLAFWFFCTALISVLASFRKMSFHLVSWALVFPNVGFTIAIDNIGRGLDSPGILWVGTIMTALLVCAWLVLVICQVRAIWRKDIMMPGKDEDKGRSSVRSSATY